MNARSTWLPLFLAMALGAFGCGDDSSGETGGSSGSGGTAGTGGSDSGSACSTACNSPCASVLPVADGDVAQCIGACETSGLLEGCDSETAAFVSCLEENDCPEVGAECAGQAQDFGLCFNSMAF